VLSFLRGFPPISCIRFSSPLYVLHAPPILFVSIWSPGHYWLRSTTHSAPHYVVFSTRLVT
jgi:hypothetical protein